MLLKESTVGLIPYLQNALKGTFWGDPARVTCGADMTAALDGQTKFPTPLIVLALGPTTVQNKSESSGTITAQYMIEQLDVFAVLNGKPDKIGGIPVDQVHQVRIDLLKAMLGMNPSTLADCFDVDFGYCTHSIMYMGDDFFAFDRERYVHEFNFEIKSEINSAENGVGDTFPEAIEDLLNIHAEMQQSGVDPDAIPPHTDINVP